MQKIIRHVATYGIVLATLAIAAAPFARGQVLVYDGATGIGGKLTAGLNVDSGTNFTISGLNPPPTFFFMDVEPTSGRVFAFDQTSARGSFAANLITVRRDGTVASIVGSPNDNTTFGNDISGLAFHPQSGTAFAINGGNLVSVNTTNAQFNLIGGTTFNGEHVRVNAIAFSPTGELYGLGTSTHPFVAPPPVGWNLYQIDTTTAELMFVGPSGLPIATGGGNGFAPTDSTFTRDGRFFVGNLNRIGLSLDTAIIEMSPQTGGIIGSFETIRLADIGLPGTNLTARGLTQIPGLVEQDPILPNPGTGNFDDVPVPAGEGAWYDPVVAEGFLYETSDGANFVEVGLPTTVPDSDGFYTIIDDVNGTVTVAAGDFYTFPNPVSVFRIVGIDPTVDGDDPLAFPTFLVFDQDTPSFSMTPISAAAVPEPASIAIWSLLGLSLTGFGYYRIKRRN